jgi:hypothetical protein
MKKSSQVAEMNDQIIAIKIKINKHYNTCQKHIETYSSNNWLSNHEVLVGSGQHNISH